jgi:hypothetical protein
MGFLYTLCFGIPYCLAMVTVGLLLCEKQVRGPYQTSERGVVP